MNEILILYYSRYGATAKMAQEVSRGVDKVQGATARVRTVPSISPTTQATENSVPNEGPPYVTLNDLKECIGYAIGSPTRFGNMAAPLKYFIDTTSGLWQSGALIGKPVGCFTSTASLHGGQETTLITMMLPFIHHGAIYVGVPYSETALFETKSGGTPYGPSHFAGTKSDLPLTDHEKQICRTLGNRIATIALKLKN